MICPLFETGRPDLNQGEKEPYRACLKEECGLFDMNGGHCSVLETSLLLQAIGAVMGLIRDDQARPETTYCCHGCGVLVRIADDSVKVRPAGWIKVKLTNEKHGWYCALCPAPGRS